MEVKDIYELLQDAGVEMSEESKAEFNKEFRKNYKNVTEFNNKINQITGERDDYKTKYDDLLASNTNNDTQITELTNQLNDYKSKYETVSKDYEFEKNQGLVLEKGIDKKYAKFVVSEVSGKVDDNTDFNTALQNYITENPQYKTTEPSANNGTKVVKVNSSLGLGGEGAGAQDVNSIMNNFILKATGRK